ncbi:MAG: PIN domain-containing protein [Planctomycetes bacterium]|nr:PIN domain-containing protein [Planctomycetota bacterium]
MNPWAAVPDGAVVALDTAPLIYFIESHPIFAPLVRPLLVDELESGRLRCVTTVLTLAEVLVQPLALGRMDLAVRYQAFLEHSAGLDLIHIDVECSRLAAEIRAESKFRLPDALQIAGAIRAGAHCFVTNDLRLKSTQRIRVICLSDLCTP